MIPRETIRSGASPVCDCGTRFAFEVMQSGAGHYVGTMCHNQGCEHCGVPNSRESHYYATKWQVLAAMSNDTVRWRDER